jgi:anthraniloyl-CoA monooxygenase
MKLRDPAHEITVFERNQPTDTFGWGVVFSDRTLDNLAQADPVIAQQITDEFIHWDDIETHFKGTVTRSTGHGFVGIGRLRLLNLLQARAESLGVEIAYGTEIESLDEFGDADLIVAADGINSKIRNRYADLFEPDIDLRRNKFVWLGTHRLFDAFTFLFEETEHGWIQVHAYRFDEDTSTFIVECTEETWRASGCEDMSTDETIAFCERTFAKYLDGHSLMSNARHMRGRDWITFPRVGNKRWHHDNIVLLGDAAHTAHFSIGSGTKLGIEDAIDLSQALHENEDLESVLQAYEGRRRIDVLKLQSTARNSTEWFENVTRYASFEPPQFSYSLLTRSQRVSHENLRLRDRDWVEGYELWFARRATGDAAAERVPPMFTPFHLRELTLANRVVVSPMAMYSAEDGVAGDFHLVHLGARAMGGAGLVMTEMTAPSADGRITPGCAGMYDASHVDAWKRIVDFVHANSGARIGLQLGHSGPKGSTRVPWKGEGGGMGDGMDQPLAAGNWPLIGPSALPYLPQSQTPRAMTAEDMTRVQDDFVRATRMADDAGFDLIELHCAHGYLLSSFLTPLRNQRTDEYGGTIEHRLRFPLAVFDAMRAVWPDHKPMSVRISATDWVEGGVTDEEAVTIARAFHAAGVDIVDVSAGQTSPDAKPVYGRMFQTPLSDLIRNEGGVPTMAVGNIFEIDHVNSIIAAGRADLCCLARPHLADPNWTLHAAAEQGVKTPWPPPYATGGEQLKRHLERASDMAINI